ncbi:uncharacterized protein JCM10292_000691 [Rhodotorula paludigena]|uniref:uncharacterized protein n=1 Tax=Rhodotorula paludigena TaxID=86838 RepID=UPI00317850D0
MAASSADKTQAVPPTLPPALPGVTKFVHVQPTVLTTRQRVRRFLRDAEGRDAALRLLQYTLRLSLYLRKSAFTRSLHVRLLAVVSALAALRRLLALHHLASTLPFPPFQGSINDSSSTARKAAQPPSPSRLSQLLSLLRSTLDLVALLSDNLYLFSRLGLAPLSPRTTARVDKLSDYAALVAALAGLAQVQSARAKLYDLGRRTRRRAVADEKRLEELEFWEARKGEGKAGDAVERASEEKRLRERIRVERRTLRGLRTQLSEHRWERVRLVAEGVFAAYDALDLETASESVKSWAGVTSASIEFLQAWLRHSASLRAK